MLRNMIALKQRHFQATKTKTKSFTTHTTRSSNKQLLPSQHYSYKSLQIATRLWFLSTNFDFHKNCLQNFPIQFIRPALAKFMYSVRYDELPVISAPHPHS